jgi:pentatricopeptide repeat protein
MSPTIRLYQAVYDILEENDRVTEAIKCFQKMQKDRLEETHTINDRPQWELGE